MMRVSIIGAGRWGSTVARHIHALPEMSVCSIHDVDAMRVARLADDCRHAYGPATGQLDGDARTLYMQLLPIQPDAVVIATPPGSGRLAQLAACVAAGVGRIRLEKPIALDQHEVEQIYRLVEEHGLDVTVGHPTLASAPYLHIAELAAGSSWTIRCQRIVPEVRHGTPITDLAPHDLAALQLLGAVTVSGAWHEYQPAAGDVSVIEGRAGSSSYRLEVGTDGIPRRSWRLTGASGEEIAYDELAQELTYRVAPGAQRQRRSFAGEQPLDIELAAWRDGKPTCWAAQLAATWNALEAERLAAGVPACG